MNIHIDTLQIVYDHIASTMLTYTEVPTCISPGTIDRYDYRAKVHAGTRPIFSPVGLVAHRYGDLYLDEMLETSTTVVSDIIRELESRGFERLPFLPNWEDVSHLLLKDRTELINELVDMLVQFEAIYANGSDPVFWASDMIKIAKANYLRWDRSFMTKHLSATSSLPVEEKTSPVETIPNMTEQSKPVDSAAELLERIRGRQQQNNITEQAKVVQNVVTQPKGKFFDLIGGSFTFVTELPNPTLKYGQLIKKEVIYTIDNIDGDVHYTFEVIDEQGYCQHVRVMDLEKAIVCQGDQIHYKDFNKVVKTMLARVGK